MRIRTIKPEFWSHPVTGRLSGDVQAIAIGLLNMADDEGYLWADPAAVKSALRPFDDSSSIVRRSIDELSRIGWVVIKKHPTHGHVGLIPTFLVHQRIDRGKASKIREHFGNAVDDESTMSRRSIDDESTLEGNREQGTGKGPPVAVATAAKKPRGKKQRDDQPTDPRHQPLVDALVEACPGYVFQGGRDGKAVSELLLMAAPVEVVLRWKRALKHVGFPTVRAIHELPKHWPHFSSDTPQQTLKMNHPQPAAVFTKSEDLTGSF